MPTKPQTPFTKFDAFILIAFLLFCAAGVIVPKVRERREAAEKARIEEASQLAAAPQSTAFPWLAAARAARCVADVGGIRCYGRCNLCVCLAPIGIVAITLLLYLYLYTGVTPIGEVDTSAISVIETFGL